MPTVIRGDFEWEAEKADTNLTNHGVTFDEAATVFMDPRALDEADELDPSKIKTTGFSASARVLLVVSTEVGPRLRIISARKATAAERAAYEEG